MTSMFFDATTVDISSNYEAIPAGDYEAMVTESTWKTTKDGYGEYLQLTIEIQSGQFQGRKLFDRLNLHNRNPEAVKIAQKQLAQMCHATGVLQLASKEETYKLHNRPIVMKVAVRNDPERGPSNEIKGYKAKGAIQQAAPFQAPRAAAQSAPAAAPLPWAPARAA